MRDIQQNQQLKNMKKQQQNDQKAFSIFQMNELAQFRSMSDGQQKQILLNNLQQGKFDEFEALIEPIISGLSLNGYQGVELNPGNKIGKTKVGISIQEQMDQKLNRANMNMRQIKRLDGQDNGNSSRVDLKNTEEDFSPKLRTD